MQCLFKYVMDKFISQDLEPICSKKLQTIFLIKRNIIIKGTARSSTVGNAK